MRHRWHHNITRFQAQAIGWVGSILILSAYAAVSQGYVSGMAAPYHWLSLAGGLAMGVNSWYLRSWPGLTLQVAWCVIAVYSLAHIGGIL